VSANPYVIALLMMLLATPLPAASAPGLTLDAALEQAINNNADLAAARSTVEEARGRLKQAGLWPNPRLEISNETDKSFRNEGEYDRSAGLSYDFPIAGRIARQADVARVDVALALAELNDVERKLLGDVAASFYEIVSDKRQIALRDRLIAVDESLVQATQARFRAGEVSALDVNTATLELQRLQQERAVLDSMRASKLAQFVALLGQTQGEELQLEATLPAIEPVQPLAQLIESALQGRPDLRLALLSIDRARADKKLASASAWEDWSVAVGVRQSFTVLDGVQPQSQDKVLMTSLSIPLPLINRNQGTRAAAVSATLAASARAQGLELRVRQEVAGQYEQTTRLAGALQAYERSILPLSARNAEEARTAYRRGQIGIADVVQIERQALDVNTGYETALLQYLQSVAALKTATFAWSNIGTRIGERSNHDTTPER
jgi:cobalt-zinc-cadmium efflux system outer membrane protein